jgi:RNA polymerase sigma factor (sigma-70 family)
MTGRLKESSMRAELGSFEEWSYRLQEFVRPVFGYALNRMGNRQEAEDLAQEIMLQCVKSLAGGAAVQNLESYVWSIARYTWMRTLNGRARASVELNGMPEWADDPRHEPLEQVLANDAYRLLRREIAYLSRIQRQIVLLYYYHNRKQSEIAHTLKLPVGTVKWHLHEAKRELRKGMDRMRENGTLSFSPIRLTGMGHSGSPGSRGDTADYLRGTLAQNIVYAAYHKPLSINELAAELGISPPFIEDEVRYLAENAFLSEVSAGKYQTNMVIWNTTSDQIMEMHELYRECSAQIADVHYDALMGVRSQVEQTGLYYPDGDYNFLMWTLLPRNILEQGRAASHFQLNSSVVPHRKDGGKYIAFAVLPPPAGQLQGPPGIEGQYKMSGPMNRGNGGSLSLWRIDTFWSDRNGSGWRNLHFKDAQLCLAYIKGELPDDEDHREDYAFLLTNQYLIKTDAGYKFNVVWVDSPDVADQLRSAMPDLSKEYKPIVEKLYDRLYEITMRNKPKFVEPQIDYMLKLSATGQALIPYVLKHLVDAGKMKEPTLEQKKTITTMMGLMYRV